MFSLALIGALTASQESLADETVARIWNEQLLNAISIDTARPTVHARNLFHISAAMYDAWAAYDPVATQYIHHEKPSAADVEAARREAVSHAAYNIILHRFVTGPAGNGPGRAATVVDIRDQMVALGYDPDFTSTVGTSPAALGNRVALAVINHALADGANEANRYANPPGFEPVNAPLTFENPGTTMVDPNRWQPLHFLGNRIDQFGRPISESTQRHLSPYWGQVTPFAMTAADRTPTGVYHDQGVPPGLNRPGEEQFKEDALTLIRLSAQLDPNDAVMIDISPASRGNTPNAPFTNSYDQVGHAINPYTGLPYEPQLIKRGDFGRLIAEFWADGPRSTAPPGHWNEIRNDVTEKMEQLGIAKRIGGSGPVVGDLEWDVKSMFALNGALHDAAIAAWNHKGAYDSSRPISFIRYMGQLGQSSDPNGSSYHPDGLPLEAGFVEVITAETSAPGQRHEHLAGSEGKIAIRSWQGAIEGVAPFDDPTEIGGVGWILAENWMPYQLISFVTPPFAGYVSGHSTYSRSAAEVLTLLTGSAYFPGGIFEYDTPIGSGLDFEYGPTTPVKLQFATYFDASDQASLSRVYGGIHPPADDFPGRRIGHQVGLAAWARAHSLFGVPEPMGSVLLILGASHFLVFRCGRFSKTAGKTLGLAWMAFSSSTTALAVQRPNILFIMSDDHAYQAISGYGSNRNTTPHIDRLAAEGVRFDRCYVTNSICAPSRACILTGKYSHKNGLYDNHSTFDGTQPTFPQLLRSAGYETALVGKWHLVSEPTGFDYWEILPGQGVYYQPTFITSAGRHAVPGYVTEVTTEKALDWLSEKRDDSRPFLLLVQHKAPHRRWDPPVKYLTKFDDGPMPEPATLMDDYSGRGVAARHAEMRIEQMNPESDLKLWGKDGPTRRWLYKHMTPEERTAWEKHVDPRLAAIEQQNPQGAEELRRAYYQLYIKDYLRCIASVDDSVGALLDYLDDSGLAENTIVVYTSDQGFYLGEHGWFDKRFMYEESLRTPLVVRWPGVAEPGRVEDRIVSNVDFAQTFLEIAGVPAPEDMQGRSLVPLLRGESPSDWRPSFYYHYYEGADREHRVYRHEGVTNGRAKLIHFYPLGEWELFDLEKDPDELVNVYDRPEYAALQGELHRELSRLREELDVPVLEAAREQREPDNSP